jgi:hypothetical protein
MFHESRYGNPVLGKGVLGVSGISWRAILFKLCEALGGTEVTFGSSLSLNLGSYFL